MDEGLIFVSLLVCCVHVTVYSAGLAVGGADPGAVPRPARSGQLA
jgi:hypothetical protein